MYGPQRGKDGGERDKSGGWNWQIHTTMYTIDNQQGPVYSVRNYSPYFKIIYNGKDSKKEYIYTHI